MQMVEFLLFYYDQELFFATVSFLWRPKRNNLENINILIKGGDNRDVFCPISSKLDINLNVHFIVNYKSYEKLYINLDAAGPSPANCTLAVFALVMKYNILPPAIS